MTKRVFAGLAVGICWLAAFLFAPGWVLFVILAAMTALCLHEFYGMFCKGPAKLSCSPGWGIAMGLAWELWCFLFPAGHPMAQWSGAVLCSIVALFLGKFLFSRSQKPLQDLAVTLLGFFYVPFLLVYFIRLAQWGTAQFACVPADRAGVCLALYLATIVKFNDVGGLAIGVPFGKHKLLPAISPKKSWEGLLGGMLASVGFATGLVALAKNWSMVPQGPLQSFSYLEATLLGVSMAILGLFGDLVESRFKRLAETKDSFPLLPGMGGILDMFDSLVFVPAFFYFYLCIR